MFHDAQKSPLHDERSFPSNIYLGPIVYPAYSKHQGTTGVSRGKDVTMLVQLRDSWGRQKKICKTYIKSGGGMEHKER